LLIVFNAHHDVVNFSLPGYDGNETWELLIDTNVEVPLQRTAFAKGDCYAVTPRSLLLLQLQGNTP
jgi:glycogen operon protein